MLVPLLLNLQARAPTPPTTVPAGGRAPRLPFQLYLLPQRAKLSALEEKDEFGRLIARKTETAFAAFSQIARAAVFEERDGFGVIAANCQICAGAAAGVVEADEMPAVRSRRGLPPRALLSWFLDRME